MTSLENNLNISYTAKDAFDSPKAPIKTKIICTIGPKTNNVEKLCKLVDAGMNVARMNFSHGDHTYHKSVIDHIREAVAARKRMCAIMLDTKGPEIRTGKLVGGEDVTLKRDEYITLTNDWSFVGTAEKIGHSYTQMSETVAEGSEILIDDGLISLTVIKVVSDSEVYCRINNDGELGQTKGVNLPAAKVLLPALTEKDKADLKFGCDEKVDFVAASFIRKASDVLEIRDFLSSNGGGHIKIISKIENREGLENFDEILAVSDGIMVARGDLGVEVPVEQIPQAQKMMISKCNVVGKPVITATQMLDSMIKNPRPTRAEMTDVANAVYDGTDCVMLSGETAKGSYPVLTVETMVKICKQAEALVDHRSLFRTIKDNDKSSRNDENNLVTYCVAESGVTASFGMDSSIILCLTESGNTARVVCMMRPAVPVVCATASELVARQLLVHRGAFPIVVGSPFANESLIARALTMCARGGLCKKGDWIVVVFGTRQGQVGATNSMRIQKNDLE